MPDPIDPYENREDVREADPESIEQELVSATISERMRDLLSERGRKRAAYLLFRMDDEEIKERRRKGAEYHAKLEGSSRTSD